MDSDESDADLPDLRSASAAGRREVSGAHSSSGWTATSAASSRAIDQDTLFGIRPPTAARTHVAAAPAVQQAAASSSSADAFRPWGAVADMGTINGGRALLGERDNTYSAPSPTPAAREQ